MMAGEIQEPFNLSLLENSIYSGSVSFGRFEKESLSWEKRSSFSHNRYLEEAERFSKPGSVTQMRAHFEAHFKKKGIRFPSSLEAQTWGEVVHHRTNTEKDENLMENTSQFGDSCSSYDDDDNDHSSLSNTLEKTEICRDEITLEGEKETKSSSATRSMPSLKNVKKANPYSTETKTSTKKQVVTTKGSPRCNTKISIDTKRQKELKTKMIVKTNASQTPTSKKTERLTPLTTIKNSSKNCIGSVPREKRTTTNGIISLRTSIRAEKRKEEKVDVVVPKVRPMPKSTQDRSQHKSRSQSKARDNAQEHSSKASCDRSLANGTAKSKVNSIKQKVDIQRSLNGIRPKSSDQTARINKNRRSLAV